MVVRCSMGASTVNARTACKQGISRHPQVAYACIRAIPLRGSVTSLKQAGLNVFKPDGGSPLVRRSRPLRTSIHASLPDDAARPADSHIPLPYAPFSAELLLAVARLGHLERYRQEVAMFHEPGGAADLTRCALLITNIFQPQLDHRPYYERLEDMVARSALAALAPLDSSTTSSINNLAGCSSSTDTDDGPSSLDISDPEHLLRAVRGINSVVFGEEGLADNAADPYDPLNGSLADVMDTKRGNQYSLAVVYLHIAEALGLPCAVVGSPEHILIRLGQPPNHWVTSSSSSSSSSSSLADTKCNSSPATTSLLVDVANNGLVYGWPAKHMNSSDTSDTCNSGASGFSAVQPDTTLERMDTAASNDINDEWSRLVRGLQADEPVPTSSTNSSTNAQPSGGASADDDESSFLSAAAEWEEVEGDASSWQEVGGYAAEDAATRNSWKAMYGPGALAEWGGLVSSSSTSEQSVIGDWDNSIRAEQGNVTSGLPPSVTGSAWYGVLESPFAAAAGSPFPKEGSDGVEAADAALSTAAGFSGSRAVTDSMDTCHGSDTDSSADASSNSNSSNMDTAGNSASGNEFAIRGSGSRPVLALDDVAVRSKYGGLAPVRVRVLLQQLLSGMKLSLLMSGRQEEGLAVIRYLRATDPFSLPDLRDEALALAHMQQYEQAAQLCREYLAVAPGAADAGMVGEVLLQVQLAAEVARARARKQRG